MRIASVIPTGLLAAGIARIHGDDTRGAKPHEVQPAPETGAIGSIDPSAGAKRISRLEGSLV